MDYILYLIYIVFELNWRDWDRLRTKLRIYSKYKQINNYKDWVHKNKKRLNKTKLRYDRKDVGEGEDQSRDSRENGERLMDGGILNNIGVWLAKCATSKKRCWSLYLWSKYSMLATFLTPFPYFFSFVATTLKRTIVIGDCCQLS